ncbi:putative FBD-associated F-box protein [Raphanus sativus]|nr:putative FBD-associated F-box protein [Raphanus sativus]
MNVKLDQHHRHTDIEIWFRVAIPRGVRTLQFHNYPIVPKEAIRLPGSLYTCQTLVTLALVSAVIVDVPLTIWLPSLKTLILTRVEFSNDEIVPRLLSGCPVLEDLTVVREHNRNMRNITIMVPSLQRLTVLDFKYGYQVPGNDDVGFVIKAPSLISLTAVSQVSWVCSLVNMPNLVKADIKLPLPGDSKKLLQCLNSDKHLSLCAKPSMIQWEQKSPTLQCLISSLDTVEWINYQGIESEKKVVMYLLENSGRLKKMAIQASPSTNLEKRYKMLQELSSTQRSSKQCQFSFS